MNKIANLVFVANPSSEVLTNNLYKSIILNVKYRFIYFIGVGCFVYRFAFSIPLGHFQF